MFYKIDVEYISNCNENNNFKVYAIIKCVNAPYGISNDSIHDNRCIFKNGVDRCETKYYNFDKKGMYNLNKKVQEIINRAKIFIDLRRELLNKKSFIRIKY